MRGELRTESRGAGTCISVSVRTKRAVHSAVSPFSAPQRVAISRQIGGETYRRGDKGIVLSRGHTGRGEKRIEIGTRFLICVRFRRLAFAVSADASVARVSMCFPRNHMAESGT